MLDSKKKIQVLNLIRDSTNGIGSSEISKKLSINRVTLSKYLSVLYSEGHVFYKDFGMAKVWFFQKNLILEYFSNGRDHSVKNVMDMLGDLIVVVDKNNMIVWANTTLKSLISPSQEIHGLNFYDLFQETEDCKNPNYPDCLVRKTTLELINNTNHKLKSTISPIIDLEKDPIGYIHLMKVE